MAEMQKYFNLLHCYRILSRHPKWWESVVNKKKKKTPKEKVAKSTPIFIDYDDVPEEQGARADVEADVEVDVDVDVDVDVEAEAEAEAEAEVGVEREGSIKKLLRFAQKELIQVRKHTLVTERQNAINQTSEDVKHLLIDASSIKDHLNRRAILNLQKDIRERGIGVPPYLQTMLEDSSDAEVLESD
ncbi:hypothetical protein PHYBLDRAFT_170633 [Phycomyces blakesleeanus NRRL 1555(-)]|uniref:No apical meristem-associated C-terminal domain-containing protein n=1 Tax=Phycomyces blakesleeanus (strain ATCC 8743b / DSM 1359 / FGSC 10004 / NBRC 33097 / NRRL 1555) TaxID=763407 RepID=A0A167LWX5_PHYB8|nr:hypothetical protein PHYBLDRAFT_170633 [Phycomyces blakesleeanus NRRL 1555(-)]OAD71257.1 hypothetical protein PHYBLDRAFT_170633 [Phycomyces blakesleeanus NRRL 1555(-)]|eukprot:XP_018289297.1 hypothetical protein PHYBLDRAFT_170633 [Phycomyces blakesleeanus NRRL 1555(-)]